LLRPQPDNPAASVVYFCSAAYSFYTHDNREIDLGRDLVRHGHALAYRRYSKDYVVDEERDRRLRFSLWQVRFTPPWEWRRMMCEARQLPME